MQRRILENRKVSLGRINKGTEVWKSSFAVPVPQVIEYDKGVCDGRDMNGLGSHMLLKIMLWTLSFSYRIMVSVA